MPDPLDKELTRVLNRHKKLKRTKDPWLPLYQVLGEVVHLRKQSFTGKQQQGEFLNSKVFDSTAARAAKISAASIRAMMWPDSGRRISLDMPRGMPDTLENRQHYDLMTESMLETLDAPEAAFKMRLDESTLDDVVFGTSGLEPIRDSTGQIVFRAWGVQTMFIAEGENGFVDTVYVQVEMPLSRIVAEYGIESLSDEARKMWQEDKVDEDLEILIAVEPRINRATDKLGIDGKPWQSLHVDLKHKAVLRRGGFNEIPIKVTRMTKLLSEEYGRSAAMDAVPDSLELQSNKETVTRGTELIAEPALGLLDDGALGNGEVDASPRGLTVFNTTGRSGEQNPIFPLFTVGDLGPAQAQIGDTRQSVNDHFSIDRLLDFNTQNEMTLGEAQIRDRLRNGTLSAMFNRQTTEKYNPVISRVFNMKLEDGDFGVMPDDPEADDPDAIIIPPDIAERIREGKTVYTIRYITPAQRIMESEEAIGIQRSWEFAAGVNAQVPNAVDRLKADESIETFHKFMGAPLSLVASDDEVRQIRDARDEEVKQARAAEEQKAAAEALRNVGHSGLVPTPGASA